MKYRKKPVVIDAIQWNGRNSEEILIEFGIGKLSMDFVSNDIKIDTLEGVMTAKVGDYIIRGIKGEFYPCKPDIFELTYELIEESIGLGTCRAKMDVTKIEKAEYMGEMIDEN